MNIKTYIINLKKSVERREHSLKETSALPFLDVELVEAVNGGQLSEEEKERLFDRKRFSRYYRRLPLDGDGEIGCTLSHRKCYQKLLDSKEPYALILEDDVCFTNLEETQTLLKEGISLLEAKKADLVLYVSSMIYYTPSTPIDEIHKAYRIYAAYGAYAYLVSSRAAKRLLKEKRPFILADDFRWMDQKGLKIVNIYPNMMTWLSCSGSFDSVILLKDQHAAENLLPPFRYRLFQKLNYLNERLLLKIGILKNINY